MTEDTHVSVEVKLPIWLNETINEIAQQADVTPSQAASVIAVLALRNVLGGVEKPL